jgi:hypothetical protein
MQAVMAYYDRDVLQVNIQNLVDEQFLGRLGVEHIDVISSKSEMAPRYLSIFPSLQAFRYTISPSIRQERAGSAGIAAMTRGKRWLKSLPLRV